jgi:hypothetical protein
MAIPTDGAKDVYEGKRDDEFVPMRVGEVAGDGGEERLKTATRETKSDIRKVVKGGVKTERTQNTLTAGDGRITHDTGPGSSLCVTSSAVKPERGLDSHPR